MKLSEAKLRSTPEYSSWLKELKEKIKRTQVRAALAASRELILFYWDLGKSISIKLQENIWGNKVIDQLSKDLSSEFSGVKGFSRRNLYYVKKFYEFFSGFSDTDVIVPRGGAQLENKVVPQTGAQTVPSVIHLIGGHLPWSHIKIILDKLKDHQETLFYIHETIENGWSRDVLALQIKSNLYSRQGKAITNFKTTLPEPQSDLARQTIKDPYSFDFLTFTKPYNERILLCWDWNRIKTEFFLMNILMCWER